METIFSPDFWWLAPSIIAATTFLAGVVNGAFKITKGIWPQVVAWVIAIGLSIGSYFANLISFGDPQWLSVTLMSIITGLGSNGIYDIPTIKAFIDSIEKWFHSKPSENKEVKE